MFYRFLSSRNAMDDKVDSVDVYIDSTNSDFKLDEKKLSGVSGFELVSFQYQVVNNLSNITIGVVRHINNTAPVNRLVSFPDGLYTQGTFISQLQTTLNSHADFAVYDPIVVTLDGLSGKISLNSADSFQVYTGANAVMSGFLGANAIIDTGSLMQNYTYPNISVEVKSINTYVLSNMMDLLIGNLYQLATGFDTIIYKFDRKFSKQYNNEFVNIYESKMIRFPKPATIDRIYLTNSNIDLTQQITTNWNATMRFYF